MHSRPSSPRHARLAAPSAFDGKAAQRAREALGLSPANVTHGMWAAFGLRVGPQTVVAWEKGLGAPDEKQLTALAGALWCAPADLLGAPTNLREYRLAQGLALSDLALRLGMEEAAYEEVERTGDWTGDDRQAHTLADMLRLPLELRVSLTGRSEQLAGYLRNAVSARWQGYVRPVGKLVPLPREELEGVLRALFHAYQDTMAGSFNWGAEAESQESGAAGRAFLDAVLDHFWELVEAGGGEEDGNDGGDDGGRGGVS